MNPQNPKGNPKGNAKGAASQYGFDSSGFEKAAAVSDQPSVTELFAQVLSVLWQSLLQQIQF